MPDPLTPEQIEGEVGLIPDWRTISPVADCEGSVWCCAECGMSAETSAFHVPLHRPTCNGMPWYSPIKHTRFTLDAARQLLDGENNE